MIQYKHIFNGVWPISCDCLIVSVTCGGSVVLLQLLRFLQQNIAKEIQYIRITYRTLQSNLTKIWFKKSLKIPKG